MRPEQMTRREAMEEMRRIDRLPLPLSGSTMMRRAGCQRRIAELDAEGPKRPLAIEEPVRKMRETRATVTGR